ncbi:MAG: FtsQ-type POTRA domain-containing protein [Acidobacteriia bacterium]|nr:FtsQ-type POTRA domain-containing protein [Terriglobia bacterium]
MAKKQTQAPRIIWKPFVLPVLAATFLCLTGLLVFQALERFLIHDARFTMRAGDVPGEGSPDLAITGLNRTPAAQVRRLFQSDEGRSVYLLPLAQRQESLRRVQWIKDASVRRQWPNRVSVHVKERKPEAFIRLTSKRQAASPKFMLIDGDGVLLPAPEDSAVMELPALSGISPDQNQEDRARRVRLMKHVMQAIGRHAEYVSEFNVSDVDNVRLIYSIEDRAVTLLMGNENYAARLQRFLTHYPEIKKRAPTATAFDLRIKDRITAIDEERLSAKPSASGGAAGGRSVEKTVEPSAQEHHAG